MIAMATLCRLFATQWWLKRVVELYRAAKAWEPLWRPEMEFFLVVARQP